jgi:hypothetical protein
VWLLMVTEKAQRFNIPLLLSLQKINKCTVGYYITVAQNRGENFCAMLSCSEISRFRNLAVKSVCGGCQPQMCYRSA